jgi:hypothetical protein
VKLQEQSTLAVTAAQKLAARGGDATKLTAKELSAIAFVQFGESVKLQKKEKMVEQFDLLRTKHHSMILSPNPVEDCTVRCASSQFAVWPVRGPFAMDESISVNNTVDTPAPVGGEVLAVTPLQLQPGGRPGFPPWIAPVQRQQVEATADASAGGGSGGIAMAAGPKAAHPMMAATAEEASSMAAEVVRTEEENSTRAMVVAETPEASNGNAAKAKDEPKPKAVWY